MNHLIVFARPPVAGSVKTRLSPALPAALAAGLYGAMLDDTLAAAGASGADRRSVGWGASGAAPAAPAPFSSFVQSPGDLGARLENAFARAFADGASHVVIVGSDAPALSAVHLDRAFAELRFHDAAIGPAADGGYWLLGLSRPAPGLLHGIPWSTDAVCATTLDRARAARLRVALLDTLTDLDTPADLAALVGACVRDARSACGPRARSELRAMGLLT